MDIVRMIMFLCDEANSFINGQTMIVDGGMSKRMIYTGDEGWLYTPKDDGSAI
jgi:NAD(P)-dependent dehydrogenase (short-subunit alcohol dehydrogenase family)